MCGGTTMKRFAAACRWLAGLFMAAGLGSQALADCLPVERLGPAPTRLVVITPATGQGRAQWESFIAKMKTEPASQDMALLFFEHGITMTSQGTALDHARILSSCIAEKLVSDPHLVSVTLMGHSIGGMITRRAYLEAAADSDPARRWSARVDNILLFTSVNRGVPAEARIAWWAPAADWLMRTVPRFGLPVHFVLEDMMRGSDFIADTRIAWIRRFGQLAREGGVPKVVQFWGTLDSVVIESDNADLMSFSGDVEVRIPDARHRDVQRLEPAYASDPGARWATFRQYLFAPAGLVPPHPGTQTARRVLFVVRGIRDSSNAEWVSGLRKDAEKIYGEGNVVAPEYGWFTAAQFAMKPIRRRNIPSFRDLYAEELARNPNTEFDAIAHSNGTYIVAESLATTPSMRFRNLALAAPVLPSEFDWNTLRERGQVQNVRYDTAVQDWPVGILCPALRALGYTDVGPAGLVLFGDTANMNGGNGLRQVGWYPGGHGAALSPLNRAHLLQFANGGADYSAGEDLRQEAGSLAIWSRLTPYLLWAVILGGAAGLVYWKRKSSKAPRWRTVALSLAALFGVVYLVLDAY